jgi:hypothetical protein
MGYTNTVINNGSYVGNNTQLPFATPQTKIRNRVTHNFEILIM